MTTTAKPRRGLTRLSALRHVDAERWKLEITRAMAAASASVPKAAELLDVSESTLLRALRDPMLADLPRAPMGRRVF